MPTQRAIAIALLLAAAGGVTAQDKGKRLYCWTENGRKVCGDALPADAAGRARTEINAKSGLRAGEVDAAPTQDDLAAAAAAEQAAAAEADKLRRDLAMVESYATEADLQRAFRERIELLDETVKASRLAVGNLRLSLMTLLRQAGEQELRGTPVAQALADNVARQHAELRRQQSLLATQERERALLDGELARALERYRSLKQPAAEATPAVPAPATSG